MIWHERTDRDPALQWFRSMIAGKLRGLNQEEVAQKLTESINLDDPSWVLGAVKKETFRSGESETRTSKLKRIRTC